MSVDYPASTGGSSNTTETTQLAVKTAVEALAAALGTDDAAFSVAVSKLFNAGFLFNDTSPDSVNEGDNGAARMSGNRNLYVCIRDNAGNERGLNIDSSGRLTAVAVAAGDVAHGSSDSGNPVKIGGVGRQTNPTAVSDGQRANAFLDDLGRQVVVLNQCRDLVGEAVLTVTSSTAETTLIAAIASTFVDITALVITNSSATATLVTVRDATAGGTARVFSVPANGGIVVPLPSPMKQGTVNNNWTVQCGTSVASIYVWALYNKNV